MKVARLHAYNENPRIEEVAEPEITGPFDVIVKIGGAGVCRTDIHVIDGEPGLKAKVTLPHVLGHENSGWIHEVGSAVTDLSVGDAVICHPKQTCGKCRPCRAGDDMHCVSSTMSGIEVDGGFAELLKTTERSILPLPAGVEPADVAAHADAGITAYHAVKKAISMGLCYPGSKTVVIGAGGLGHIGIQSLKAMSATEVIVLDKSPEACKLAEQLGADTTVLADGTHVDKVLEMTDGRGAEAVIDFVGEHGTTAEGFAMLRRAGSHFVVGYGENIDIPTHAVISTERSFVGNLVGTYNELAELMALQAQGKVTLHTQTYPLDALNDAISDLVQGKVRGRGIVVP